MKFLTYFNNVTESFNLRVVEEDYSFENEESYRLMKYHYGNEIFLLQPISKQAILKTTKKAFLKP